MCCFQKNNSILSYENLKRGCGWICLIVGVICYLLHFFVLTDYKKLDEVVEKLGDVLVIGAVVGFITNAATFFDVFTDTLQRIIYGKNFLNKRNDIDDVWRNVSKQRFALNMDGIEQPFLNVIANYFPDENQDVCYLRNYTVYYHLEWDKEKGDGWVKMTKTFTFDLIARSDNGFQYQLKSTTNYGNDETSKNNVSDNISSLIVDGKESKDTSTKNENDTDGKKIVEHAIRIDGGREHKLKIVREKEFNIKDEPHLSYKAKHIVQNMEISISLPDNLRARLINRGTQCDLERIINDGTRQIYRYEGLVMPKQGYIFTLYNANDPRAKSSEEDL